MKLQLITSKIEVSIKHAQYEFVHVLVFISFNLLISKTKIRERQHKQWKWKTIRRLNSTFICYMCHIGSESFDRWCRSRNLNRARYAFIMWGALFRQVMSRFLYKLTTSRTDYECVTRKSQNWTSTYLKPMDGERKCINKKQKVYRTDTLIYIKYLRVPFPLRFYRNIFLHLVAKCIK